MTDGAETSPNDMVAAKDALGLPDWAPWAVLAGLVGFGVLGGIGVIPLGTFGTKAPRMAAAETLPAATKTAAAAHGTTRVFLKERQPGIKAPAVGSPAAATEPEKVAVAHLVVSYRDTGLGKAHNITRTREEAKKRADEAQARAKKGEDFGKLVAEYTDEPGGPAREGKFGKFRREDAVKPFADAAFALQPGEISPVTESAFGFHVIRRTE